MNVPSISRVRAAVSAIALCLAAALPASASAPLPAPTAQDVSESYHLLSTSYFRPVDPQTLVDKAHDALVDLARKHGSRIDLAPIHASDDATGTVAALDGAIADAAAATHGSTTDFAYAAIDAMAKAVDDRYTTVFDAGRVQGV